MRFRSFVSTTVLLTALASTGAAQRSAPAAQVKPKPLGPRLDLVDHQAQLARIALTGDLGMAPLPPVYADSPRHDLLYADRFPSGQEAFSQEGDEGTPVIVNGWIPSGPTGTGTAIGEIFRYQVPIGYDPLGPPVPLVIAYHGYGSSANSVSLNSTIDEEANARGWLYMAPTGMDDKLFGSPLSQQNTSAAIKYMLDHYNVDHDRLYMVGFSMGGGVVANFAARHRDPDGMMIAALGIVSGTYDWEQTYNTGTAPLKALMENPYNFGGSPNAEPFRYHQASDLRFLPSSYPPLPGTLDPANSMVSNLGSLPVYMVWDQNDTVVDVLNTCPVLVSELQSAGADLTWHTVTGTVNPANGQAAPHSWNVLDEAELFDFFDGKSVVRYPTPYSAQLDVDADVSWASLAQRFVGMFSFVDGDADAGASSLAVTGVMNALSVRADLGLAGLSGTGPFDVQAQAGNASNFTLELTGFECPPAYLIDAGTGMLRPGTESDPLTGTLSTFISGGTALDVQVVCDPTWDTALTTAPNPTPVGGAITMKIDAPAGTVMAWMVIGFTPALSNVKAGHVISIQLGSPTFLVPFVLDANGDLEFPATIPATGELAGTSLLMQTIGVDGSSTLNSISNLWVLKLL